VGIPNNFLFRQNSDPSKEDFKRIFSISCYHISRMEKKEDYFFRFFWIEHKNGENINSGTAFYKSNLKPPYPALIKAFVRNTIIKDPLAVITYHTLVSITEQVYLFEMSR
jgi:hypothetical protein